MEIKNLMARFRSPLPGEIDQTIYTIEFLTYVTSMLPRLLAKNKVVLVDGYIMRRIALSRWNVKKKNSIPESIILKFIQKKLLPLPDITFYLDISVDEARKRIIKREYIDFDNSNFSDLVLVRLEEKEKLESIKKIKFELDLLIKNLKKSQKIINLNALNTPDFLAQKCVKEITHIGSLKHILRLNFSTNKCVKEQRVKELEEKLREKEEKI
jgi:thymidylate kinase